VDGVRQSSTLRISGDAVTQRLSIIVPTLNEGDQIQATLGNLQPLRRDGVEVLLVDGGSTDATVEHARALADKLLSAPAGRARQMNHGAAHADGNLLLFLHADTHLPADAARAVIEGLSGERQWGRFDVRIDGRARLLTAVAWGMNLRSRLTGIATGDQAMFVRRDAFDRIGGFPDQPLMEDIELSKRLKRLSRPLCLSSTVTTSGRRWERWGFWRTVFLMWRLRWLYYRGVPAKQLARLYR
jgi:rSAM/selenodomain-associated transferase 2